MWLALLVLVLSWLINKFMIERMGEYAIYYGAPVIEEILKSLPAYLLNRSIFHVHFWFGIGEALYDLYTGHEKTSGWAAVLSIISHSFFGGIVYLFIRWTGNIIISLMVSIPLHMGWNYGVMQIGKIRKIKRK